MKSAGGTLNPSLRGGRTLRALSQLGVNMESWLSGRKRLTANEVRCKSLQGFESLTLRQVVLARDT